MPINAEKYANDAHLAPTSVPQTPTLPPRPNAHRAAGVSLSRKSTVDSFAPEAPAQERGDVDPAKHAGLGPAPSPAVQQRKKGVGLASSTISTTPSAFSSPASSSFCAAKDTQPLIAPKTTTSASTAGVQKPPSAALRMLQGTISAYRLVRAFLKQPLVQKVLLLAATTAIFAAFAALAVVSGGTLLLGLLALATPPIVVAASILREHRPAWLGNLSKP